MFKGKVTRTADSLDPTARTERVEVQLPSEQGRLLPGMYLTVRFKVQQAEPALIVPANTDGHPPARGRASRWSTPGTRCITATSNSGRDFGKTIEIVGGLAREMKRSSSTRRPTWSRARPSMIAQDDKKGA